MPRDPSPDLPHVDVPPGERPDWLRDLPLPATKDEALAVAEAHGVPAHVLEFLETLPAAIFTSEEGLRHAFSLLTRDHEARPARREPTPMSEDGISG